MAIKRTIPLFQHARKNLRVKGAVFLVFEEGEVADADGDQQAQEFAEHPPSEQHQEAETDQQKDRRFLPRRGQFFSQSGLGNCIGRAAGGAKRGRAADGTAVAADARRPGMAGATVDDGAQFLGIFAITFGTIQVGHMTAKAPFSSLILLTPLKSVNIILWLRLIHMCKLLMLAQLFPGSG